MKEIKPEDLKEMSESELHKTLYEYFKPVLEDCSQGARLKYIREYRQLSTKEVAELCPHLTGENKIRSIQKYESNTRSPKPYILEDLAKVYDVSINAIRKYDGTNPIDELYRMVWLEEQFPGYEIDLKCASSIPSSNNRNIVKAFNKWINMREKRKNREISYAEYIEYVLHLNLEDDNNEWRIIRTITNRLI